MYICSSLVEGFLSCIYVSWGAFCAIKRNCIVLVCLCARRQEIEIRTRCLAMLSNSLLHSACYLRTICLLSASFLRHFSFTVAGLRAPLSRFLEGALYIYIRN